MYLKNIMYINIKFLQYLVGVTPASDGKKFSLHWRQTKMRARMTHRKRRMAPRAPHAQISQSIEANVEEGIMRDHCYNSLSVYTLKSHVFFIHSFIHLNVLNNKKQSLSLPLCTVYVNTPVVQSEETIDNILLTFDFVLCFRRGVFYSFPHFSQTWSFEGLSFKNGFWACYQPTNQVSLMRPSKIMYALYDHISNITR